MNIFLSLLLVLPAALEIVNRSPCTHTFQVQYLVLFVFVLDYNHSSKKHVLYKYLTFLHLFTWIQTGSLLGTLVFVAHKPFGLSST